MDTMSSGSTGLHCTLYLLPLDIVSTDLQVVIQEPISYPMKNNIINDLHGKVRHTFIYQ